VPVLGRGSRTRSAEPNREKPDWVLREEVEIWCRSVLSALPDIVLGQDADGKWSWSFWFSNDADLLAFRMRWL